MKNHRMAAGLITSVLVSSLVLGCGCGKKQAPESEKSAAEPPATTAPGVPTAAPQKLKQPAPVAQPGGQTDMAELNRCLMRWVLANRRRPNDFEDFAATAGVKIPPPPVGKKYFIGNDMHIILVDR